MNKFYLVTGSAVLNDEIFFAYGGASSGEVGTATQRAAAYAIAETQAAYEIGTPLTATIFTGTFNWVTERLQLPWNRLQSIQGVTGLHEVNCNCTPVELSGCAWIIDPDNGVIDLRQCTGIGGVAACSCAWAQGRGMVAKQVRIVYTVGLDPVQVTAYPGVLQGLTIAADINLQEMIDPSAEGDPMIESFSDIGYSEKRGGLRLTEFGGSPRANRAAKLLEPLRYFGGTKLR